MAQSCFTMALSWVILWLFCLTLAQTLPLLLSTLSSMACASHPREMAEKSKGAACQSQSVLVAAYNHRDYSGALQAGGQGSWVHLVLQPSWAGESSSWLCRGRLRSRNKLLPYLQKATDPLFNASMVLGGIVGSDVQKPNGISHLKLKKQLQFAQLW